MAETELGARILQALSAIGWNQSDLARALDVSPQAISQVVQGDRPGRKRIEDIARELKVSVLWLTTGVEAPAWANQGEQVRHVAGEPPLLVGIVTAGDGNISNYVEPPPRPMPIPTTWRLIQVEGMSAYPVVFPKQFVFVDTDRATRPDQMTSAQFVDLDDNLVVIQVQTDGDPVRAYLKRFCKAAGAPGGFILASVDSGRRSPFIEPREIFLITPVVGVLYQDPTKPRVKINHAVTVVPRTEI